jgi:anti-sigma factor RsiW
MNTGCEFYSDALVALARGELGGERGRRVEAHLADCPDCRGALEAIRAVQSAPAPVPDGLEARIQAAVRAELEEPEPGTAPALRVERPARRTWRPWALPAAAAAALVVWLGVSELAPPDDVPSGEAAVAEYEPYGTWPATDGEVAGDLVLSELSVEELEALLEEMER